MPKTAASTEGAPADAVALYIFTGVAALLSIIATAVSPDPAFRFQGWIFTVAFLAGAIAITIGINNGRLRSDPTRYADGVIRAGVIATMFWAIAGLTVGVLAAAQLSWPSLLYFPEAPWLNFGRIRPLHTSAVIFAFGGNGLIATSFYVVQRTCKARLAGGVAPWFVFWGYQLFIVLAATGYLAGITQSREYAEPEWYVDLWLTIVWVVYLLVFLGTLWKRKEPHIYVANWFYLAFIVTIAILHLVNNAAVPVGLLESHSYSAFAGVQDALVQWWYGHNAVAFFLTVPFLAMMYYFVPKRAERPVYSYRLSIVHFWSLIFIYIWAGPHHLHYTALPQWAQTLGMTFSIMLWMPSWGGMINGFMTLSGAWDKVRTDPVIRMMVVAMAFYGMATFEGPLMSIRAVNALSHYTDWTVGHVHAGTLGWVAMISIGSLYALYPRLLGLTRMYSVKWIDAHFWLHTIGVVFYIAAMWIAGVMQGLMWRATGDDGTLTYTFVEAVAATYPYYLFRFLGGVLVLSGMFLMAWNVIRTYRMNDKIVPVAIPAPSHA